MFFDQFFQEGTIAYPSKIPSWSCPGWKPRWTCFDTSSSIQSSSSSPCYDLLPSLPPSKKKYQQLTKSSLFRFLILPNDESKTSDCDNMFEFEEERNPSRPGFLINAQSRCLTRLNWTYSTPDILQFPMKHCWKMVHIVDFILDF